MEGLRAASVSKQSTPASGVLQRKCSGCKKKEKEKIRLQRTAVRSGPMREVPPIVHEVLRSPGQPLDAETRSFMEPRFGQDFSRVRVHTDAKAAGSAKAVNALAYTVGQDLVFGEGQYAPQAKSGQKLMAHELTHVIQQSKASFPSLSRSLELSNPGDELEQQADARALSVTERPDLKSQPIVPKGSMPTLQRFSDSNEILPKMKCPPAQDKPAPTPIHFDFRFGNAGSNLSPDQETEINNIGANWWITGGDVRVDGYASTRGSNEINWPLSCDRVLAVVYKLQNPSSGTCPGTSPGIPANAIIYFAHGETDEFGPEELNRRAIVSIYPAATVPPTPLTCSCFADVPFLVDIISGKKVLMKGDHGEAVRRLQQVLILFGYSLPRYGADAQFGDETGTAVSKFQSDQEMNPNGAIDVKTLGNMDQKCANEIGSGCISLIPPEKTPPDNLPSYLCGPDVTNEIARIWSKVITDFSSIGFIDKLRCCLFLIEPFTIDPLRPGTWLKPRLNKDAFDTLGLFQGTAGWLRELPYHPPCARPGTPCPGNGPLSDCHEHPGTCSNTVAINNACWLSGTPNYGTYGIMMRQCYEFSALATLIVGLQAQIWMSFFSLPSTIAYVAAYKSTHGENPVVPATWAGSAWVSGPRTTVSGGNRPNCICDCPVGYGTPGRSPYTVAFDYVWLPVFNPIRRPLTRGP